MDRSISMYRQNGAVMSSRRMLLYPATFAPAVRLLYLSSTRFLLRTARLHPLSTLS